MDELNLPGSSFSEGERLKVSTIREEAPITEEKERILLNGKEIADIVDLLSQPEINGNPVVSYGEKVALGSSTAYRIWQYYQDCLANQKPFVLGDLNLSINDLDCVYSGDRYDQYLEAIKGLNWGKDLRGADPKGNTIGLRNFPLTRYYAGYLKVETANGPADVEVEVFDNFTYGGHTRDGQVSDRHPVFTMRVGSSHSVNLVDDEGVSINLLDPSILALQSFLYAREGKNDIERAHELIGMYLADSGNDIFSLLETARVACPHKSIHFARFVLTYIEDNNLEENIFAKYFGSNAKDAFEVTKEMIDLFDPEAFPYHNYFNHIINVIKVAKPLINDGLINSHYAEEVMLAIYAHDAGMDKEDGSKGHVEKGSKLLRKTHPIASELIKGSETIYSPERGLSPLVFIPEELEKHISNLELLGMSRADALEAVYFMGLVDISNVIATGNVTETFKVLMEDYGQDLRGQKSLNNFVHRKSNFYVSLYENIRNGCVAKLRNREYEFTKIFAAVFCRVNNLNPDEIRDSGLPLVPTLEKELLLITQEKIDLWEYIQARPLVMASIQRKYLEAVTSSKDPRVRDHLLIKFNRYISRIDGRARLNKMGASLLL